MNRLATRRDNASFRSLTVIVVLIQTCPLSTVCLLGSYTFTATTRMNSRSSSMYMANKGPSSSSTKEGIQQRIAQKQEEYESLTQLKLQSDSLLRSMQDLETKLGTLNEGTATVALVLSNWANVFKAINMSTAKMQRNDEEHEDDDVEKREEMPETLVRIATGNTAQT